MSATRTVTLALLLTFSSAALAQSEIADSLSVADALPEVADALPEVADAAMQHDPAEVTRLLRDGADVNAVQADGATALHWAAYHGDADLAETLLDAGANPAAANRNGSTPLWLAANQGDAMLVETLLDGGADANELLPLGRRPLMLAARSGVVATVRVLLEHDADVNAKETQRGTNALMQAADQGHADVMSLLIEHGADVAAVSAPIMRDGRTAALGQSEDPRKSVRRQVISVMCDQKSEDLATLTELATLGGDRALAVGVDPQILTIEEICKRWGGGGFFNEADASGGPRPEPEPDSGELTALIYAARAGSIDAARVLLDAGADVNQSSRYGWSALLAATQNQNYQLAKYLIERGADVNLANKGAWTPLYLATDNRNIEGGDYPTRRPDMDTLEFITLLLDSGADVNARMVESSETRTVFTNQWLDESGATAFLRASQSGDIDLMRLLLEHGADPHINTELGITPLAVAAGIGWVEGVTQEWSTEKTVEAVKLLLELGIDPNYQANTGRVALHGAAHKGATEVARVLVEAGARMDLRDFGNTDNRGSPELAAHTWLPIDYADGLVRVGVQSAIPHPETAAALRALMIAQGLEVPPADRTLESICIVEVCSVDYMPVDYTD